MKPNRPMRAPTMKVAAIQIADTRSRICFTECERYLVGERTSGLSVEAREQNAATERCAGFAARDLVDMFASVQARLGADMQEAIVSICNKRFTELEELIEVHDREGRPNLAACVRCARSEVRYIRELIELLVPAKT